MNTSPLCSLPTHCVFSGGCNSNPTGQKHFAFPLTRAHVCEHCSDSSKHGF